MKKYEIPQIDIIAETGKDTLTASGETYIEWKWDGVFDDDSIFR